MHIERVVLENFRCFGPQRTQVVLDASLVAFVGDNGTGKTALMQALQRMFGVTAEQRRLRKQDFHVPGDETDRPVARTLVIEAIVAFPELDIDNDNPAVPAFFKNMAAEENGSLKVRLRLQATWSDDGTLDGAIEESYCAVQTFGTFDESDLQQLRGPDRSRIQLIYIPATRDGASQVTAFVRGRLWRAINWSQEVKDSLTGAGNEVNQTFSAEAAVSSISTTVTQRWQQLHSAGTDATPIFRPVDTRWQEFIRRVEVVFHPTEDGHDRALEDLSDGQRSLFHMAMAAATLDIEARLTGGDAPEGFAAAGVPLPALTILALEEPENNLAPFYLSRIIKQVQEIAIGSNAQAIVSSHSPSILARVDPSRVRHFRLNLHSRCSEVRQISLPAGDEDASKFIREAVRAYPELYFARYVILGEGATEEAVLPLLAKAMDFPIDRSFVAVVPLGGRHVNHLWRLLADLQVPYATLLDLDWGRSGGGFGRVKTACEQLLGIGHRPEEVFGGALRPGGPEESLAAIAALNPADIVTLRRWIEWLERFRVYFSDPLDLDYLMLTAYPLAYRVLEAGMRGPAGRGDPRDAVLGEDGSPNFYDGATDDALRWYRYLFLGRGKPSTHVRVLSRLTQADLVAAMPQPLQRMLANVRDALELATR
ncbi:ATP-dependent nuclease [Ralstonia solanacearum]|uniref:ATP-dependent nuclease n=1 Tax=Ralstonia solanacearum TaxID=305 RepID=UPI00078D1446|nr:AAA family ATPase [Ralstonia solanacearum]AMP36962.1 ATP-dependent endonuclease [Ralstonia solanacearum]AXV85772.1 ATP-dependent endonuclease [Ralstonia solanacearum]AXW05280.1 ATP-dependent endonuclease [Ralstonia solanacearum]AXW23024.1 ATP-dependent endonuclease [Ralstonia solanacearum]AXW79971.1 ATP-dependent endonuclease [Ralstonia solanacearum]